MAKKRVIAYFMHEHEEYDALSILENTTSTDSFVIGDIDENDIAGLEERGLIISEVKEERPEPLDELIAGHMGIEAPQAIIDRSSTSDIPTLLYTAQIAGPLVNSWKEELSSAGAQVVEAVGSNRFNILIQGPDYSAVSGLEFIQRLAPISLQNNEPTLVPARQIRETQRDFQEMTVHDIRLHNASDRDEILSWLGAKGIPIAGHSKRKIRVYLDAQSDTLFELAILSAIERVEEYTPPKLYNNRARKLVGVEKTNGSSVIPYTGAGQVIGIADTGLDKNHPDFSNRIRGLIALGRIGDASDLHGHGTHVAGSALGDGSSSGGNLKGTAPGAELFFQSIMDSNGKLTGLPMDLNDLFQEAYDNDARIHNNSWGADSQARYTFNSIEVDEFARENLDMTIVVAAGNDGSSRDPVRTEKGYVDWMSVGAPATAKNVITVGASRSDRKRGGYAKQTFGEIWPNDFPDAPIKNEFTSGNAEAMAAFSSRGPCSDRRIKPDLVAPGTNIASAKSSRAPLRNFDGSYPGHSGKYAYMGGTSMAAPLVSGAAALVREFYQTQHNHNASSALVKATLINGTRWLSGADSTAEYGNQPNFHQGFGCLNMSTTVPNPAHPKMQLAFLDEWATNTQNFTTVGQRYRFEIDVSDQHELRFCLVWTDRPANALQNNLNLFVQEHPGGKKYMGNSDLPLRLRLPDEENNVEVVRLLNPIATTYLIQVSAGNILDSGQPFALVVTGSGLSDFRRR